MNGFACRALYSGPFQDNFRFIKISRDFHFLKYNIFNVVAELYDCKLSSTDRKYSLFSIIPINLEEKNTKFHGIVILDWH